MQTVHFEQRVGNREMFQSFFFLFFFFCLSLTIRKLFTYGPPPRYCDGMEGPIVEEASSSMPYLFPPISLLLMFTVYSRKLLTFRGAAQKWNWWKANKKVDWHGSRKWNLFIYLYVCARTVRVQWALISLVRTNDKRIVCGGWYCREREKERGNKGIISVKFHVSFVTRVSFFSSFWWLVLTRINGRDSMKFSCIRNCSR